MFVKVSNLPVEASEDDLRKFLVGIKIEAIEHNEGMCTLKLTSLKDVREALTFD